MSNPNPNPTPGADTNSNPIDAIIPERSWPAREGLTVSTYEYPPNQDVPALASNNPYHNPFNTGEETITYYGHASKEAYEEHQQRVIEGLPPPTFRFNPVKAAVITYRSRSKLSSYSNFLWPIVPVAMALQFTVAQTHPRLVFAFNFLGIIPAGNLLSFAAGELEHKLPKPIAATLEILSGGIVEIIISLILLFRGHFSVVREALLGSMLANLLLITGACFLAGGIRHNEQEVAEYVTEISNAALLVSVAGIALPSVFFQTLSARTDLVEGKADSRLLHVSRIVSFWLLASFIAYTIFQLKTHSSNFHYVMEHAESQNHDKHRKHQYRKKLSVLEAIFLSIVGLVFVTFCAYYMVEQIPIIIKSHNITELFMGLILVPFIEKASEHLTALNQAYNNQQTLAIAHCLGGTVQTALLVTPLVVIIGWCANLNMDLRFEFFLVFALLLAVLVVGNFLRDNKTHWLEGMFLLMVWLVIATAAYNYPDHIPHGHGSAKSGAVAAPGIVGQSALAGAVHH
ncbi:hypothetical protein H072_6344 [Dactylellina haptotyla CBS 200.50]|uniref:Sodium/calcium exchanger membrane region domain-containing protein n=1 Tax=Dactylellina haptotyla (strain CBS 200.50) TaxID=1284197 RepID=S8AA68_DACHA|nr:hypothetical protein H072_6344 [Dactylellina haptotyla CBS 200.50]